MMKYLLLFGNKRAENVNDCLRVLMGFELTTFCNKLSSYMSIRCAGATDRKSIDTVIPVSPSKVFSRKTDVFRHSAVFVFLSPFSKHQLLLRTNLIETRMLQCLWSKK